MQSIQSCDSFLNIPYISFQKPPKPQAPNNDHRLLVEMVLIIRYRFLKLSLFISLRFSMLLYPYFVASCSLDICSFSGDSCTFPVVTFHFLILRQKQHHHGCFLCVTYFFQCIRSMYHVMCVNVKFPTKEPNVELHSKILRTTRECFTLF